MANIISSYKDLIVWQKSIELVTLIYKLIDNFPKSETYGLVSQIRRAVVSIPANIAEGHRRNHLPEFIQFLAVANGSAAEVETYFEIIKRLNYADERETKPLEELLLEILKMLNVLSRNLKRSKITHL